MGIRRLVGSLLLLWLLSSAAGWAADVSDDGGSPGDGEDRCASGLRVGTFAGPEPDNPEPGYADGPWYAARFNAPSYVIPYAGTADHPAAQLIISDSGNHVIRVVIDGLEVRTLAGVPKAPGFRDGYRTVAQFNQPAGLATDEVGNIYIADSGNGAIRKLDPDGYVTTIAGGPDRTLLKTPGAIAYRNVFGKPMLIIADIEDHCIKILRVNDPTNPVMTLAGTCGEAGAADGDGLGEARFTGPKSIGWGADFELEINEQGEWRRTFKNQGFIVVVDDVGLRRLTVNNNGGVTVSTLRAGEGAQSVYADFFNNLYVTKPNENRIEGIRYQGEGQFDNRARPLAGDPENCGDRAPFDQPLGVSAYFWSAVVADTNHHALRVLYDPSELDPDKGRFHGKRGRCFNCGPMMQ